MKKDTTKTPVSCPKCHGVELTLFETFSASNVWSQDENGLTDPDGISWEMIGWMPKITGVSAECRTCKHTWSLNEVHQMTDLYPEILRTAEQKELPWK